MAPIARPPTARSEPDRPQRQARGLVAGPWHTRTWIALLAIGAIGLHLLARFMAPAGSAMDGPFVADVPLILGLGIGGLPIILDLLAKLWRREFGADLLAGLSIMTCALLGEYLAGCLVVLMLAGGQALEAYAVRSASSVLEALARRMPSIAHRKGDAGLEDMPLGEVAVGDCLTVLPHEICPVDGIVIDGRGLMDESYLTGEPYLLSKVPGSAVLSGAVNGDVALTIRAERPAEDSRYAKIMRVMRDSEQRRPNLRRLGDRLGAMYTPFAVSIALIAWAVSGSATRFLAVLVVATPCPLLIAIPVAIIGSISLAARRGIIVKDPTVLEVLDTCRTAIFDKTGTLTYGQPKLTEASTAPDFDRGEVLSLVASLEQYSRHPLSGAVLEAARECGTSLHEVTDLREPPGQGLRGTVNSQAIQITSRKAMLEQDAEQGKYLPPAGGGLECVVLVNGHYAATLRFRDEPRVEGAGFIHHLGPRHNFERVMLVSGDRESEVRYLAERVGIKVVLAGQSPEQKAEIVRRETLRATTVFMGDGINDAPALTSATVGIAFGQGSDITAEAAGAVVLDSSLLKVDELFHISRRLRVIALQSALGGMTLSLVGMVVAAAGYLPPVAGALVQEAIDLLAVLNALRAAVPPRALTDLGDR